MEKTTGNYTILTAMWCWCVGHFQSQWECLVDNSEAAQVCLVYCSIALAVLNIVWTIEKLCYFLSRWAWRKRENKRLMEKDKHVE